jgi:hypothetical protein
MPCGANAASSAAQTLSGADSLKVFTAEQLQALVPVLLDLHAIGLDINFVVGALWFVPLGYLVFTSGFLPRILAVLVIVNGLAYLIDSLAVLLLPDLNLNLVTLTGWVEVLFALWLLIRRVNVERRQKRVRESA